MSAAARHFGRRASAALEFAMVAPVFVLFLMAVLGVGLDGLYQFVLDDAVRDAARQIQIGGPASTSGAGFVAAVCQEFSLVAGDCSAKLSYSVQANVPPANFADLVPVSLSSAGTLPNTFPALAANYNVVVQAAYPLPFMLPLVNQAVTYTGTNSILATTTVRMERYR